MGKTKRPEKKSKKKHKHKEHKEKKKKSAKKSKKQKEAKQPKEQPQPQQKPIETVAAPPPEADLADLVSKPQEKLDNFAIPVELMNSKSHAPETPAEYQRRQLHIRRVTDPVTGRIRVIKGDGEVLEEIVGRERHVEINKAATAADGKFYQESTIGGRHHKRK